MATDQTTEHLAAALEAARAARNANPCRETRDTYRAAWQALEDATPRRQGRGTPGSRAGRRQAAERHAQR